MDLLILTRTSDVCAPRFIDEARDLSLDFRHFYYDDLVGLCNPVPQLPINSFTRALPRSPYYFEDMRSYESVLRIVLESYPFARVLDGNIYQTSYHQYEDKLYQAKRMDAGGFPFAGIVLPSDVTVGKLPVIVKKRLSSLSRNNYLITTLSEWEGFVKANVISEWIIQPYFPLAGDYRVLVLGERVLGVVERQVFIRSGKRVAVKIKKVVDLPDQVKRLCIEISRSLGGDFVGVDVGLKQNGEYFVIEYNFTPRFIPFEKLTGLNVAREVLKYLMS